jgi:hypothetical protein
MAKRNRLETVAWALAGVAVVCLLGAYGGTVAAGERGGFTMNFPASGREAGGPSPRELTGVVVVSLDRAGIVKRLVQPSVVEVASHVVRNVGTVPRRIRFEAEGFGDEIEWHSRDRAWNPNTHEIERDIAPGEAVDFGLLVQVPKPLTPSAVPLQGAIRILDARNGTLLSTLPVRFVRSGMAQGGDCCEQ